MKIVTAQINTHLGHLDLNSKKIIESTLKAKNDLQADLVVFPELSLLGYPPYDLLERKDLIQQHFKKLKETVRALPKDIAVIFGGIHQEKGFLYNAAFFVLNGKIIKIVKKSLLPSYKVFYDERHFISGDMKNNFVSYKGKKIFLTICEDIWGEENSDLYPSNPLIKINKKIDHFINISSSPYTKDKMKIRKKLALKISKKHNCTFTYVNQVGAQDELVFDGQSFQIDKAGKNFRQLEIFQEETALPKLKKSKLIKNKYEEIFEALVLGVREYFTKSGFQKAHLGLSGGVDSALVYVIAVKALGIENVTPIALPGPHSTPLSLDLAEKLAQSHGTKLKSVDFVSCYKSFLKNYEKTFEKTEFGLMHENIQARFRALFLMAFSNQNNSLLLATSNKSELCVGYSTLYGDQCGALMPIGDVLKTEVFELCKWYNKEYQNKIPSKIITRPPSAELKPNQKDSDSLPDYQTLDLAIENVITRQKVAKTDLEKWVLRKSFSSEYKRWQSAPILRISSHSFGRGRMMPLAHKFSV
jgi:NAD+ synthase (glutamine-hydrolysing)